MELDPASPLRLVRRPISFADTFGRKRLASTQRDGRDEENERLRSELQSLRRQLADTQLKYEAEIERMQSHMQELKERSTFAAPIATAVRSSISTFTSVHKELQLELGEFHSKTVKRIRGREADVYNLFASRLKQLEGELTVERAKNLELSHRNEDPWTRIKTLEAQLVESEEFHTQLLADIKVLKEKCREFQTTEEVRCIENETIMQENVKLKHQLEDLKALPQPSRRDMSTQESTDTSDSASGFLCVIDALRSKLASSQKEVRTLTHELLRERSSRTELEKLISQCLEDVRSQAQSMEMYNGRMRGTLTPRERQSLIQQLLLEEKVLSILKLNAFPVGTLRAYLGDASPTKRDTQRSKSVVRFPR